MAMGDGENVRVGLLTVTTQKPSKVGSSSLVMAMVFTAGAPVKPLVMLISGGVLAVLIVLAAVALPERMGMTPEHQEKFFQSIRLSDYQRERIEVLLESSSEHGGKVDHDSVSAMKKFLPSIDIYIWDSKKKCLPGKFPGSVHAKCAVADGELAFITSANLSTAAMERNMELGVLVRGGHLPDELHRHLEALVATETVERI